MQLFPRFSTHSREGEEKIVYILYASERDTFKLYIIYWLYCTLMKVLRIRNMAICKFNKRFNLALKYAVSQRQRHESRIIFFLLHAHCSYTLFYKNEIKSCNSALKFQTLLKPNKKKFPAQMTTIKSQTENERHEIMTIIAVLVGFRI